MERAGDILKDAFTPPLGEAGAKYLPLFKNWGSVIGKDLVHRAALRDIRKDALLVEVAHPGWRQAILLRKKEIFKRIDSLYPGLGIREIRVSIVKKPAPRVQLPNMRDKNPPENQGNDFDDSAMEGLLEAMNENDLKKALKRLYSTHAKKKNGLNPPITGE